MSDPSQMKFQSDGRINLHDSLSVIGDAARTISASIRREAPKAVMDLAAYIETRFVPDHVVFKTGAGRIHYQAILKHILNPDEVDRMFAPYSGASRTRLKPLPEWPYLDHVRLCDLQAEHVRRLMSSATEQGYSPQTIKHIRNVLGAVISRATKDGLFRGENPVTEVKLPAIVHRRAHTLTIAEAKAVLRLMDSPSREIALIAMTTGMGVSEICALQWKNVNMMEAAVHCDGVIVPPHHALIKRHWNDEGLAEVPFNRQRTVEIPEPLLRRIQRPRRGQMERNPESFVFAQALGTPLCPTDVGTRLGNIGQQLGIPWLSWPVLRRAHQNLLTELRMQLSDELMAGVR